MKPYSKTRKKILKKSNLYNEWPSCKQRIWIEFDKSYICPKIECGIKKQKHQIDKEVIRRDIKLSTRFYFANKKISEINFSMIKIKFKTTEEIVEKLQSFKSKTK